MELSLMTLPSGLVIAGIHTLARRVSIVVQWFIATLVLDDKQTVAYINIYFNIKKKI